MGVATPDCATIRYQFPHHVLYQLSQVSTVKFKIQARMLYLTIIVLGREINRYGIINTTINKLLHFFIHIFAPA